MLFFIIYIVCFLVTIISLHKWGKRMGFNYDQPHPSNDDWDSNTQAYLVFSLVWFTFWPMVAATGIWRGLMMLSKYIEKKIGNDE